MGGWTPISMMAAAVMNMRRSIIKSVPWLRDYPTEPFIPPGKEHVINGAPTKQDNLPAERVVEATPAVDQEWPELKYYEIEQRGEEYFVKYKGAYLYKYAHQYEHNFNTLEVDTYTYRTHKIEYAKEMIKRHILFFRPKIVPKDKWR